MSPSRSLLIALCGALIATVTACDAPPPDPPPAPTMAHSPSPIAQKEAQPEQAAQAEAEQHRTRRGDRNPFDFAPEVRPPIEVTQIPDTRDWLSQAELVGIVSGTANPKAMFVDNKGHGHILTESDLFKDGARVMDIRDREVEIALTPTRDGGAIIDIEPTRPAKPETIVIRLHHDEISLATPQHPDSPLY